MSDITKWRHFNCPWCNAYQNREVYKSAETEVICEKCKNPIGIVTNEHCEPIRIARLIGIEKLIKPSNETQETSQSNLLKKGRPDFSGANGISINIEHSNVSFGGGVNVTTIYNETIKIIDSATNVSKEQKTQAKNVLDYVKENASPFLPIIAEAIKKAFGLG